MKRIFIAVFLSFMSLQVAFCSSLPFGTSCGADAGATVTAGSPNYTNSDVTSSCGSVFATNSSSILVPIGEGLVGSFNQQAEANASASAQLGILGAKGSVSASSTPSSYTYDDNGQPVQTNNTYTAEANAGGGSLWFDVLINPNPFPEQLGLGTMADAIYGGTGLGEFTAQYDAFPYLCDRLGCQLGTQLYLPEYVTNEASRSWSDLTTVQLDPFGLLYVQGNLLVSAGVGYTGFDPGSFAVMDGSATAGFYVDVLTPGGSYTTASGHVYSESALGGNTVPEPSTLILLATGMAGTLAGGRAKTKGRT